MNYYQIADAAKKVNVESHVLRYWEEELQLPIERNKQGHRLYTDEDLSRFLYIKELKKEGLQLRAIRTKVHMRDRQLAQGAPVPSDMTDSGEWNSKQRAGMTDNGEWNMKRAAGVKESEPWSPEQANNMTEKGRWAGEQAQGMNGIQERQEKNLPKCGENDVSAVQREEEKTRKAARLCMMLQQMVVTAVHEENKELLREIKKGVAETVSKEMNYQFSIQEQREEEHYKKLDEILRERERRNRVTRGDRKRMKKEQLRAEKEKQRAEKESVRREKEKMQQERARREKEKQQQEKENARREKERQQQEKADAHCEKGKQQEKESARRKKEKQQRERESACKESDKQQGGETMRMEEESTRREKAQQQQEKENMRRKKEKQPLEEEDGNSKKEKAERMKTWGSLFGGRDKIRQGREQGAEQS